MVGSLSFHILKVRYDCRSHVLPNKKVMVLKQNSLCDILFHVICLILKAFSVLQIVSEC